MASDERTQRSLGIATFISRRRFLKQTAMATAGASVPYLAGRSAAFGKEQAKSTDAALDRALEDLVAPGRRSCFLTRTTIVRPCSSILVPDTNILTRTT
jgi:hypothetical protein